MNYIINILAYFCSFKIRKKMSNLLLLIRLKSNYNFLKKNCNFCGNNVRLYHPFRMEGQEYISIGENCKIGAYARIDAIAKHNNYSFNPKIEIGNHVSIGDFFHVGAISSVYIGDNVLIGSNVLIIDHSHGKYDDFDFSICPNKRILYSKGNIVIQKNVWIGDKVTILPGVVIGENSVIGANSVITKNIPKNSIVVGNPARVIKIINNGVI